MSMTITAVGKVDTVIVEVDSDHAFNFGAYKVLGMPADNLIADFFDGLEDAYNGRMTKLRATPYGIKEALQSQGYEVSMPPEYVESVDESEDESEEMGAHILNFTL